MPPISYHTVKVDDGEIFYREAGPPDAPALLLLHGFPSDSRMFRDLIPLLADRFTSWPGFGRSDTPSRRHLRTSKMPRSTLTKMKGRI